ncbi:MAG: hypothetical protein DWQ20_00715 [Actinobacteria bacterium]|nr:MAG: hypothetical protein DWQ20_00715 [Actinomycetota bacterium]
MARKIGDIFLEFTLRKRGVDEGLDETKRKAEELGSDEGPLARAGKQASRFQEAVAKILIPFAVFASIDALVNKFRQARKEAEDIAEQIRNIGSEQSKLAAAQALRVRQPLSELRTEIAKLSDEQTKAEQAVLDQLDRRLEQINIRGKEILADFQSLFTDEPVTREQFAELARQEIETLKETFRFRRQLVVEEYDLRKSEEARLRDIAAAEMRIQIREEERARKEMQERLFRQQVEDVLRLFTTFREEALRSSQDIVAPLEEIRGVLTQIVNNMPSASGEVF